MKRSTTKVMAKSPHWTFVTRRRTESGGPVLRKVAVSELEAARRPREKRGPSARLDAPDLSVKLTRAFRLAVRRAKLANGRAVARI
jgi:hypothetical protein